MTSQFVDNHSNRCKATHRVTQLHNQRIVAGVAVPPLLCLFVVTGTPMQGYLKNFFFGTHILIIRRNKNGDDLYNYLEWTIEIV